MSRTGRALAAGLAIGLLLGYAAGVASATPRSASVLPAVTTGYDGPGGVQTGVPQELALPSLSPAVASERPTATEAAQGPGPTPASSVAHQAAPGFAVAGRASWYCLPGRSICTAGRRASGLYAAAGPRLRSALGPGWRGATVEVCRAGTCVQVRLVDWCQCLKGTSGERLVDLYASVFRQLATLSRGVVKVTVAW